MGLWYSQGQPIPKSENYQISLILVNLLKLNQQLLNVKKLSPKTQ